ncbi:MAG: discoidin domain-containing protein, partial [Bacteroidales bacterium]
VYKIYNISIERGCLANFESDYNIFYCESGTPMFLVEGVTKTFSQWQAMGYDLHSRVINPDFIDTNRFVPGARLNYGTNLGTTWQSGLATTASWTAGSSPATVVQNGTWQNGAVIYPESVVAPGPEVPPEPLYTGSVVEGATPSLLEMKYNLVLSTVPPPVSAFTVTVNSIVRSVLSVAIAGATVQLNLSSPVVYGDVITVSYTKPDTLLIGTPAGGIAATLSPRQVTNRVGMPNSPPVITLSSISDNLSGFESKIDASASSDPDNDKLTFTWTVPENIPVASTNESTIRFLCPVVSVPTTFNFVLSLSDGKTTQSAIIPVEIVPYKPELQAAVITGIEASGYQYPNEPSNVLDGNTGTMWSASGDEQWLTMDLRDPFNIQYIRIAFDPVQKREFFFDIYASEDKVSWDPVLIKSASCAFAGDPQVFDFPPSKSEIEFRYVKLVGHSNSVDSWNCISEFKIMGLTAGGNNSYLNESVQVYPNPARNYLNIHFLNMSISPDCIKIVDLAGRVVFSHKFEPDVMDLQLPVQLRQGIYVVQIESGGTLIYTQKLIIKT